MLKVSCRFSGKSIAESRPRTKMPIEVELFCPESKIVLTETFEYPEHARQFVWRAEFQYFTLYVSTMEGTAILTGDLSEMIWNKHNKNQQI